MLDCGGDQRAAMPFSSRHSTVLPAAQGPTHSTGKAGPDRPAVAAVAAVALMQEVLDAVDAEIRGDDERIADEVRRNPFERRRCAAYFQPEILSFRTHTNRILRSESIVE